MEHLAFVRRGSSWYFMVERENDSIRVAVPHLFEKISRLVSGCSIGHARLLQRGQFPNYSSISFVRSVDAP